MTFPCPARPEQPTALRPNTPHYSVPSSGSSGERAAAGGRFGNHPRSRLRGSRSEGSLAENCAHAIESRLGRSHGYYYGKCIDDGIRNGRKGTVQRIPEEREAGRKRRTLYTVVRGQVGLAHGRSPRIHPLPRGLQNN